MDLETIVCVAHNYNGIIWKMDRPSRHHHIIWGYHQWTERKTGAKEQGFWTSKGRWVDRYEGCQIARAADQIIKKHGPDDTLFSEDMW